MKKGNLSSNITNLFKKMGSAIQKHSPEILTGIAVAGSVTSTVLAVKATPKAIRLIEDAEDEKGDKLTVKETVQTCWKCYIPSALSGAAAISCMIGSQSINSRRSAALATAYKLSEEAFSIYKDKVIETIGEKKEEEIRSKVAKERIDRDPADNKEVIITGNGNVLCYDVMSGRYFESSIETLRRIQNDLNMTMINGFSYVSLSEFYDELGLRHTKTSDDLGWNLNRDGQIDIRFDTELTEDGRPCVVVDFGCRPNPNFDKFFR